MTYQILLTNRPYGATDVRAAALQPLDAAIEHIATELKQSPPTPKARVSPISLRWTHVRLVHSPTRTRGGDWPIRRPRGTCDAIDWIHLPECPVPRGFLTQGFLAEEPSCRTCWTSPSACRPHCTAPERLWNLPRQ